MTDKKKKRKKKAEMHEKILKRSFIINYISANYF